MTKKDEASPRQRQIMEARWAKAREECPAGTCVPSSRFHIAGCQRRSRVLSLPPDVKVKVTNLNTGATSEATTVREAMDANGKQAVHLDPLDFDKEYWDQFERGQRRELTTPRIIPVPKPEDVRALTPDEKAIRDTFLDKLERETAAPARPWWKFWGRRG